MHDFHFYSKNGWDTIIKMVTLLCSCTIDVFGGGGGDGSGKGPAGKK